MKKPGQYLIRMVVFLIIVVAIVLLISSDLFKSFLSNPGLNGVILGVLVIGVIHIIRQPLLLLKETSWLDDYRFNQNGLYKRGSPKLLAPIATILGEQKTVTTISALSQRSLLDGLASRLEETRDISRYMIGLLIFLGLLGTFWGLLQTINSVAGVISGLSAGSGDMTTVFSDLKKGLQAPLEGMGTAFSSSLFGLAGSLVLGFLELQSSQAQNHFYNDVEEWLARQTRLSSGPINLSEGEVGVPAYVEALLEKTADSLERLERTLERGEESRLSVSQVVAKFAENINVLVEQMRTAEETMIQLAKVQQSLEPIILDIREGNPKQIETGQALLSGLNKIEQNLVNLVDEISGGRAEMVSERRAEIRVLSRTIAAAAERTNSR